MVQWHINWRKEYENVNKRTLDEVLIGLTGLAGFTLIVMGIISTAL